MQRAGAPGALRSLAPGGAARPPAKRLASQPKPGEASGASPKTAAKRSAARRAPRTLPIRPSHAADSPPCERHVSPYRSHFSTSLHFATSCSGAGRTRCASSARAGPKSNRLADHRGPGIESPRTRNDPPAPVAPWQPPNGLGVPRPRLGTGRKRISFINFRQGLYR